MYLNVTGSSASAGLGGVRVIRLPLVVTPRGVMRGMGAVLIRSRSRGMGDAAGLSSLVASYLNSFMVGLTEPGAATPDVVSQTLTSAVQNACADQPPGTPCDPSSVSAQIAAGVQAYTQAYQQAQTSTQQLVASGKIAAPSAPAPPAAAAAGLPLGVAIQNLSGGSSSQFRVGDQWQLVVTGPANSPVTGSSNHNGQSNAAAPFGSTDATGRAVISGTMAADTVGTWSEQWMVGGQPAGSVSFSVVAAPSPAPAGTPPAPPPASSSYSSSSSTPPPAPATSGSFLTDTAFTIGGFAVPVWGVLVVGGVAVYAMSGRSKR